MSKIYIDFDGVIMDTEEILFEEWRKLPNHFELSEDAKKRYIQLQSWKKILHTAEEINESLRILKELDPKTSAILTKINSLENEGIAKIQFLREQGIRQEVILVPFTAKKIDVVSASGNILVDDTVKNLIEWKQNGGDAFFFNHTGSNLDSWGAENTEFETVKSLHFLKK